MMDDQTAIDIFQELRESLDDLGEELVSVYQNELRDLGIGPHQVDHRVKTLDSFATKLLRKGTSYQPDPVARMRDKLGVRIEVMRLAELSSVVELVQTLVGAEDVDIDYKGQQADVPGIGYTAVHVDLIPRDVLPAAVDRDYGFVEVQCRTMMHGLWAAQTHDLGYKGVLELDREQSLRLDRLPTLISIHDEEVARVRDELLNDERYPAARVILELRRQRGRLGRPDRSQPELTALYVQALLQCADREVVLSQLQDWVDSNRDQLATTLRDYADTGRQVFVDRPEGLLAFFLLDQDHMLLARRWDEEGNARTWLENLADVWDVHLPAPL
jgi:ppGpp synthetase/RelA/SpoT-type nucleotidyltranferase